MANDYQGDYQNDYQNAYQSVSNGVRHARCIRVSFTRARRFLVS
jgi:hypothetical protein